MVTRNYTIASSHTNIRGLFELCNDKWFKGFIERRGVFMQLSRFLAPVSSNGLSLFFTSNVPVLLLQLKILFCAILCELDDILSLISNRFFPL